jgi:hypothetical protein
MCLNCTTLHHIERLIFRCYGIARQRNGHRWQRRGLIFWAFLFGICHMSRDLLVTPTDRRAQVQSRAQRQWNAEGHSVQQAHRPRRSGPSHSVTTHSQRRATGQHRPSNSHPPHPSHPQPLAGGHTFILKYPLSKDLWGKQTRQVIIYNERYALWDAI